MSYIVRLGYPDTAQGYPQFGVEAVVSDDNGQTWDMDHRYILAKWTGNIIGDPETEEWLCGVQSSSTVLMPDGTLLTAFGTGFVTQRTNNTFEDSEMDIALVRWRVDPVPEPGALMLLSTALLSLLTYAWRKRK